MFACSAWLCGVFISIFLVAWTHEDNNNNSNSKNNNSNNNNNYMYESDW